MGIGEPQFIPEPSDDKKPTYYELRLLAETGQLGEQASALVELSRMENVGAALRNDLRIGLDTQDVTRVKWVLYQIRDKLNEGANPPDREISDDGIRALFSGRDLTVNLRDGTAGQRLFVEPDFERLSIGRDDRYGVDVERLFNELFYPEGGETRWSINY